jgi:hypothetical protein
VLLAPVVLPFIVIVIPSLDAFTTPVATSPVLLQHQDAPPLLVVPHASFSEQ